MKSQVSGNEPWYQEYLESVGRIDALCDNRVVLSVASERMGNAGDEFFSSHFEQRVDQLFHIFDETISNDNWVIRG